MQNFYPTLAAYAETLSNEFDLIPSERKAELQALAEYIFQKKQAGEPVKINVICTHNSRRSHMGQLWLLAAAAWYGVDGVETFSGGTEATAFHPNAVRAMRQAGFSIEKIEEGTNPVYRSTMGEALPAGNLFSKKYSHEANPQQGFAAILVCSEADAACPFVPGAEARFTIKYDDPKAFDGTPEEERAYAERCRQIGREMLFAVKK